MDGLKLDIFHGMYELHNLVVNVNGIPSNAWFYFTILLAYIWMTQNYNNMFPQLTV